MSMSCTTINLTYLESHTKIGQRNGGSGSWAFLEPLEIGKHAITFEGGFSNGSKGYSDVTNNSMSFGFPVGWDDESRYDLVVLPSDSYFSMMVYLIQKVV